MLSYPSSIVKKRRSSLSSFAWLGILHHIIFRVSLHVTHESSELPARERKLTFLSVTYMTDMSYIHNVCTYIARIDLSFKALR